MAGIESLWPLFGLRIRSGAMVLRLPTDDDLVALASLARAGIHAADAMPFATAWSTLPSPAFERGFVAFHWRARASWTPEAWDLPLLVEHDGVVVGAQSINADAFAQLRTIHTGSWLGRPFQGRGLGKQMRAAILGFAFDTLGAELARTQAFLDNHASNGVSVALGYEPDGTGRLAPQGVARETQRHRMTIERWRAGPRATVDVEGFEPCRALFGTAG